MPDPCRKQFLVADGAELICNRPEGHPDSHEFWFQEQLNGRWRLWASERDWNGPRRSRGRSARRITDSGEGGRTVP